MNKPIQIHPVTVRTATPNEGRTVPMHPIQQQAHVEYRHRSLTAEAAAQRLAAAQRRQHRDEHGLHPTLVHDHAASVRTTVGRLLIGLGTAIAGFAEEAGAGRAA